MLLLTLRVRRSFYYGDESAWATSTFPGARSSIRRRGAIGPPLWWNRDQCRAPMPWSAAANGEPTTGRPLRMTPDAATRVAAQAADPDSAFVLPAPALVAGASAALQTHLPMARGRRGGSAGLPREAPEERVLMALTTEDRRDGRPGGREGTARLLLRAPGRASRRSSRRAPEPPGSGGGAAQARVSPPTASSAGAGDLPQVARGLGIEALARARWNAWSWPDDAHDRHQRLRHASGTGSDHLPSPGLGPIGDDQQLGALLAEGGAGVPPGRPRPGRRSHREHGRPGSTRRRGRAGSPPPSTARPARRPAP
jgi:hypothetical protein